MPQFLWVVKDRQGELTDALCEGPGDPRKVTPAEADVWVGVSGSPRPLVATVRKTAMTLLCSGALVTWGLLGHGGGLVLWGAALGGVAFLVTYGHQVRSATYWRLNAAKLWGRWSEVARLLGRLERLGRLPGAAPLDRETTRIRAQLLAATGRKTEAAALFETLRADPGIASHIFQAMYARRTGSIWRLSCSSAAATSRRHATPWLTWKGGSSRSPRAPGYPSSTASSP